MNNCTKKILRDQKKPDLALGLIKRCLFIGYRPGIVLLDSGYGNNTSLLIELEKNNLKYLGGLAKNRKISFETEEKVKIEMRLDSLAESLPEEDFTVIELNLDKPRTVWVTTKKVFLSQLEGTPNYSNRHECC